LIESASAVAGTEIGCQHFRRRIILHEKADRDAAVGAALLDQDEPLPARDRLAAIDPFNEDEGRVFDRVHVRLTPCFCQADVTPELLRQAPPEPSNFN
jgi:hypothetical protein